MNAITSMTSKFRWGNSEAKKPIYWKSWARIWLKEGLAFLTSELLTWHFLQSRDGTGIYRGQSTAGKIFSHSHFMVALVGGRPSYLWLSLCEGRQVLDLGLRFRVGLAAPYTFGMTGWLPLPSSFRASGLRRYVILMAWLRILSSGRYGMASKASARIFFSLMKLMLFLGSPWVPRILSIRLYSTTQILENTWSRVVTEFYAKKWIRRQQVRNQPAIKGLIRYGIKYGNCPKSECFSGLRCMKSCLVCLHFTPVSGPSCQRVLCVGREMKLWGTACSDVPGSTKFEDYVQDLDGVGHQQEVSND